MNQDLFCNDVLSKNNIGEMQMDVSKNIFYKQDCIIGCKEHIKTDSIDLIITDPPYGINGDTLHKHYNRQEELVIDGYVEIPRKEYPEFSRQWVAEAERILRPGGSIYIVSGYTNLIDILNALKKTDLKEVNHIIWKYNFGVHTTKKYISSHYHILFYRKPGGKPIFNTYSRFGSSEKNINGGSLNYEDREDVWIINREYKPGQIKNKNELPKKLLIKMIQYSSNEGDIVADLFLGSFSTAKVAIGLNRYVIGFEKNKLTYDYQSNVIKKIRPGYLLKDMRIPSEDIFKNRGKIWTEEEKKRLYNRYDNIYKKVGTKRKTIDFLSREFGRGYFSILNLVDKRG
jgi:site-specific DNA-methyltransferase (adenine-specific)